MTDPTQDEVQGLLPPESAQDQFPDQPAVFSREERASAEAGVEQEVRVSIIPMGPPEDFPCHAAGIRRRLTSDLHALQGLQRWGTTLLLIMPPSGGASGSASPWEDEC